MILRGIFSISLLAIALYAGFARFPFWSILLIAIVFAIAYVQSKWYLWKDLFQTEELKLYQSLAITYFIQIVVVAIFYLLGSGIARLLNQ
ncbi:hypothetical protein H6F67_00875 [Microcoleus sp. FACHB-1515]|uniref:hypothetical protein n=1 Tax=Cyanophyceae TaxID=3028117 RepID=UPI0016821819|nr:hypothetical protein [Microcoleus sp. FACHB-1515]MBD2088426.1 hypothetical protein [Microcoleus sp. FACHB-1515]